MSGIFVFVESIFLQLQLLEGNVIKRQSLHLQRTPDADHWFNGYSVRKWPGRPAFNPMSSHTKHSKNGT